MFPDMAGGAGHYVERAWLRVERETFPLIADLAAETEFAGRGEGEPEYLIEVLFVAVPADAGADIILRAERMLDAARRQGGEAFNPSGQRHQPPTANANRRYLTAANADVSGVSADP